MKRIILFIVLLFGITVFYSCKKDKRNASLIGTWEAHYGGNGSQVYADIFVFNADSTFTETRTLKDTVSGKILGYNYYCTGKFRTSGEALTLTASSTKTSKDYGPAGNLTEVVFVTVNIMHYTLIFNSNNNMFYIQTPPCPINANCAPPLHFYRQ